jgi:hypothetical protein
MGEAHTGGCGGGAIRFASGNAAAPGATDWLCLAAAPTFAIMALLTGVLGGGPLDAFCSAAQGASPLSGMVPMYLLMSAFHSAPWLKLVSDRRSGARRSRSGVRQIEVPNLNHPSCT